MGADGWLGVGWPKEYGGQGRSVMEQHIHGGIGFSLEYDLHFYYRRAKAFELKFGPQALHLRKLGAAL